MRGIATDAACRATGIAAYHASAAHPSSFIPHPHPSSFILHPLILPSLALCVIFCLASAAPALAVDQVTLRRGGKTIEVTGRVLTEAKDGGLLVLGQDGTIWAIPPEEQVEHTADKQPFQPLGRDELAKRVLAELPRGFRAHSTTHYLIFYNTSPAYAQWCGSLFERLYLAFHQFLVAEGF